MGTMITTEFFDQHAVGDLVGAGAGSGIATLGTAKLMLFTGTPAISKTTAVSDLTEASWSTYARPSADFSMARRNDSGEIVSESALCEFQLAILDPSIVITGVGVVDSTATHLLMAGLLDNPANLVDDLSALGVMVQYNQNDPQNSKVIQIA